MGRIPLATFDGCKGSLSVVETQIGNRTVKQLGAPKTIGCKATLGANIGAAVAGRVAAATNGAADQRRDVVVARIGSNGHAASSVEVADAFVTRFGVSALGAGGDADPSIELDFIGGLPTAGPTPAVPGGGLAIVPIDPGTLTVDVPGIGTSAAVSQLALTIPAITELSSGSGPVYRPGPAEPENWSLGAAPGADTPYDAWVAASFAGAPVAKNVSVSFGGTSGSTVSFTFTFSVPTAIDPFPRLDGERWVDLFSQGFGSLSYTK